MSTRPFAHFQSVVVHCSSAGLLGFQVPSLSNGGTLKPVHLNDFLFWIKSELILLESFLFYYYYFYFISDEFGKNNSNNENIVQNIIKG